MNSPPHPTPNSAAKRLAHLLEMLVGLVFCAVVALNFASAASRYLAKRAILGADEVQVYAMVWLVFIGAAVVAARRAHLCMDVLVTRLSARTTAWRGVLENLLGMLVCGAMSWASLRFVVQVHGMDQLSDGAGVPMWIPHSAVLVGFSVMTLIFARALVIGLRQRAAAAPTPSRSNP